MARKLDWNETKALQKKILDNDPYRNVFFANDIDEGEFGKDYEIFALKNVYFLLWKKISMVCYAEGPYDLEEVEAFLASISFNVLNGMAEFTDPLVPIMEKLGFRNNRSEMMVVNHETFRKIPRNDGCRLMLAPEDFEKMADLYATSKDFDLHLENELDKEDWACDMAEKEFPFCSVGFFVKKRLVAASYVTGYTRKSAMVVGVYVHPDFENKGIGTAMVSELTDLALNENLMEFLTLFYSTQKAKHIYEKLGYQPIGAHNLFKKQL